jgi:hypothetical protein
MRTNPNIILSGNQMAAPQLPDVNAMTQTRTAGMENIYAIEQQRAAQAQAAQKEQAAAQEAALTQALLPAYTYGIQTGDIAGAFDLVPPEMQANLAPYVQALEGKNPEEVRSALIGSLSASKAGQEALAAIQRAETAGIQRGQLELSRQRLAQDAAAANQPPQMTPYQAAQIEIEKQKLAAGANETRQKETAAEVKARLDNEKRAKDIDFAVKQVEAAAAENGLLDVATGSYLGNLVDTAAQLVGYGTEGAIANARMKPIADLVLKLVPRFEGPQAIPDVQSYKEAAGDLANPNLPTSVKKAAAAEIVRLLKDYPGQFEYAGDGGAAAGGDVIDFNDLGD